MQELQGKAAVVTGAASGIGLALARRCAAEGMKVVLADVEPAALTAVEMELRSRGVPVLGVLTDVARSRDVERLAERAVSKFGAVHVLFNNAGVGMIGPATWECTRNDWDWIIGVNLWGVVHGLRIFVPIMIDQGTEGHIVNTASAAGLMALPGMGVYAATKSAVALLSETLSLELARRGSGIKVSVVFPGLVRTRMTEASRNRPVELRNEPWVEAARRTRHSGEEDEVRRGTEGGMPPEDVADAVFRAIREERFYVFTHPWVKEALRLRTRQMLEERAPWNGFGLEEPVGEP
jgi:NAD(P)-dependent dehydrogenase (short-subunit alcohol dehydrogenase family)